MNSTGPSSPLPLPLRTHPTLPPFAFCRRGLSASGVYHYSPFRAKLRAKVICSVPTRRNSITTPRKREGRHTSLLLPQPPCPSAINKSAAVSVAELVRSARLQRTGVVGPDKYFRREKRPKVEKLPQPARAHLEARRKRNRYHGKRRRFVANRSN